MTRNTRVLMKVVVKMFRHCLIALLITPYYCLAVSAPCAWYPSADYEKLILTCSGANITGPPLLLPDSLQNLHLSGTGLRKLSRVTFQGHRLHRLSSLSITEGVLTSVEPRALCSLPALKILDLSDNNLEELDGSSFVCNHQLQRVDLSGNANLSRLPSLVSDSIDTLLAEGCNLTDVQPDALQGLASLRLLYLDGNLGLDCSLVKEGLSEARPSLTVICGSEYEYTKMETLPRNVDLEPSTICPLALYATANGCHEGPAHCTWYPSPDYENIFLKCAGEQVPNPPWLLPSSLQTLQLSGVGLRSIDRSTFQDRSLPRLSSLSVTNGILHSVGPFALCSLTGLTVLDLSNNRLEDLDPFSIECNNQLHRLDISGNPSLNQLPAFVSDSIDTLLAENSGLTEVPDSTLRGLTKLRLLYLDGNTGLDCPSVKKGLHRNRPSLTVICGEDAKSDL